MKRLVMKRVYSLIFLLSVVVVLTIVVGLAYSIHNGDNEPGIVGGYSVDRALTADDVEVFKEAMSGLVGVVYEPTLVSTQIVAGVNYRFTTTATVVYPGAEPSTAYVYVFKSLDGKIELTEIVKIDN
jgi:uncharacterized membrane protein